MHAIADTHALIWYLLNDPRLSPAVRAVFTGAAAQGHFIGIPTISIVEVIYLTEKGRIPQAAFTLLQSQLSNQQTFYKSYRSMKRLVFACNRLTGIPYQRCRIALLLLPR